MIGHVISRPGVLGRHVTGGFRQRVAAGPSILPVGLGILAWGVIGLDAVRALPWPICTATTPGVHLTASTLGIALGGQSLMLVAMMAPVVSAPVHHIVARSFKSRQVRGSLMFLSAYLAVWLAISAVLVPVSVTIQAGGPETVNITAAALLLMAAFWQVLPIKQVALRRCARAVPLRQDGYRADIACARYGIAIARDCVVACWALMLAPMIAPAGLGTMILVQAIILTERRHDARPAVVASVIGLTVWAAATIWA